jgi:hypothetical protein
VVEVEKKIQALKTQFLREQKKSVDSKRSGSSPKRDLGFGYEQICQNILSIQRSFI